MKEIKVISGSKMSDSIIDFLSNLPLFSTLKVDELKNVAEYMNLFEIEKGKILFKEGDKGDYVCYILNGVVDVIKSTSSGEDVVIASLSRGRSIGEMSVIDYSPRSATAKAQTKASFITLSKSGFDKILKVNPETGITILKGITRLLCLNLRKTSSRLADHMLSIS